MEYSYGPMVGSNQQNSEIFRAQPTFKTMSLLITSEIIAAISNAEIPWRGGDRPQGGMGDFLSEVRSFWEENLSNITNFNAVNAKPWKNSYILLKIDLLREMMFLRHKIRNA